MSRRLYDLYWTERVAGFGWSAAESLADKTFFPMDAYHPDELRVHNAAFDSMRAADPERAEEAIREYFGADSAVWTKWDEQFLTFVEAHRRKGLIYGTVGDGWHFLFSADDCTGEWFCIRDGMTGKGILREESVVALREMAVEKGLYNPPILPESR